MPNTVTLTIPNFKKPHPVGTHSYGYDATQRNWQTWNGRHVASYPAGNAGKREAQLHALQLENECLHARTMHALANHPQLGNRPLDAAMLVANGNVLHIHDQDGVLVAFVESQREKTAYRVEIGNGLHDARCDCDDYTLNYDAPNFNDSYLCKHIIALAAEVSA